MPPEQVFGGQAQPSVRGTVLATRLLGLAAWTIGLVVYLTAWTGGSGAWHAGFLAIYAGMLGLSFGLAGIPRRLQRDADADWVRELHDMAIRDDLTGLYNRRYFNHQLARAVDHATLTGQPLTLAIIDLDQFKQINDSFGHQAGDVALRVVAECLNAAVGDTAVTARIGGDEFAILLPGVALSEGRVTATAIQHTLAVTPLLFNGEHPGCVRLQAAIGVVENRGSSAEALLIQADKALYADKGCPPHHLGALIAS